MLTASSVVCSRCPLAHCGRKSIVDGSGPLDSKLFVIGEGPGKEEDRASMPFVGSSGKLLRTTLAEICAYLNVDASKIWYTNTVRCRPPENRTPTNVEIAACTPWLQEELDEVKPVCILAVGAVPRSVLADLDTDAEFVAARHPAYILRRRSELDKWKEELEDAVRISFNLPPRINLDNADNLLTPKQFEFGQPDIAAKYLAADTEFDNLEDSVIEKMVGWSLSDGHKAIFSTDVPPKLPHAYLHAAGADLINLDIDPDDLPAYDDTLLEAYPLQQKYGWPYLGLKRPDGKGLAQIVCNPPVIWKHMLKSDLLRVYIPSGTVFKSGPRKGLEKPGKWKKNVQFSEVLKDRTDDAIEYGATDAFGTSRLAEQLDILLDQNPWARDYYNRVEKPLVPVLLQMERTGIRIDVERLNEAAVVIDQNRYETETRLKAIPEFAEINIGSNQQLGPILLDMGLVDGKLTETGHIGAAEKNILGAFGVDADIELPQTPEGNIARDILKWREMGKLKSVYIEGIKNHLDLTSRIHPRFNATGTYTTRLSSSDPNAQNIPSRSEIGMAIRRAFITRDGCSLVGGDCSQFQLRIFGKYTYDPIFMDAYLGGSARGCLPLCKCPLCDIHQRFTDLVNSWGYHVERASHTGGPSMKNGVFATLYGVAGKKLANTIGIPEDRANEFLANLKFEVPSISTWPEIAAQEISASGYVETMVGWRMYFPDYGSAVDKWHKEAIRQAACGKVQGTEGGLIKLAMRRIYEETKRSFPDYRLILQVHDEYWQEGPNEQAEEVKCMMKEVTEATMRKYMGDVPILFDAKVIQSWDQGK